MVNASKANFKLVAMAAVVGLVSAAAGIGLWKQTQRWQQPATSALIALPEARVIADFALHDQHGRTFTLDRLRGRWSLIFFGFTNCPDVCPSTLYDLKSIDASLRQNAVAGQADHQVVFVSVDPERDSSEKLRQYMDYFDPAFIGVTGDQQQLTPLTRQLGIAWRIEEHEPGDRNYGVDHSASVLLTDPMGRLHGVFPAPIDADMMIRDLSTILHDR